MPRNMPIEVTWQFLVASRSQDYIFEKTKRSVLDLVYGNVNVKKEGVKNGEKQSL